MVRTLAGAAAESQRDCFLDVHRQGEDYSGAYEDSGGWLAR